MYSTISSTINSSSTKKRELVFFFVNNCEWKDKRIYRSATRLPLLPASISRLSHGFRNSL